MGISLSYDRLISSIGFLILVRWHFYVETGSRPSLYTQLFVHVLWTHLLAFVERNYHYSVSSTRRGDHACWYNPHKISLNSRLVTFSPRRINKSVQALHWRHNDHDGVSNHQPYGCLLNRLFGRRSKKTSKLRVTGLCVGNSPVPVNSHTKRASNAENVSIWWRHQETPHLQYIMCSLKFCKSPVRASESDMILEWHKITHACIWLIHVLSYNATKST